MLYCIVHSCRVPSVLLRSVTKKRDRVGDTSRQGGFREAYRQLQQLGVHLCSIHRRLTVAVHGCGCGGGNESWTHTAHVLQHCRGRAQLPQLQRCYCDSQNHCLCGLPQPVSRRKMRVAHVRMHVPVAEVPAVPVVDVVQSAASWAAVWRQTERWRWSRHAQGRGCCRRGRQQVPGGQAVHPSVRGATPSLSLIHI